MTDQITDPNAGVFGLDDIAPEPTQGAVATLEPKSAFGAGDIVEGDDGLKLSFQTPKFDKVLAEDVQREGWDAQGEVGIGELVLRFGDDMDASSPIAVNTEYLPFGDWYGVSKLYDLKDAQDRVIANEYGTEGLAQRESDFKALKEYVVNAEELAHRGLSWPAQFYDTVGRSAAVMTELLISRGAYAKIMPQKILAKEGLKFGLKRSLLQTAEMGIISATTMNHRVQLSYLDRRLSDTLAVTDKGMLIFNEAKEKPAMTWFKAYGDVFISNLVETAGGEALAIGGGKLKNLLPKKLIDGFKNLLPEGKLKTVFGKGFELMTASEKRLALHGAVVEIGEERLDGLLKAVTGVDDREIALFDKVSQALFPNLRDLSVEVGLVTMFGGLSMASTRLSKKWSGEGITEFEINAKLSMMSETEKDSLVQNLEDSGAIKPETRETPEVEPQQSDEQLTELEKEKGVVEKNIVKMEEQLAENPDKSLQESIDVATERVAEIDTALKTSDSDVQGLSKAEGARLREETGLDKLDKPVRRKWETALKEADPSTADSIAQEVINNPRTLSDSEQASLVVRAAELANQHEALVKKGAELAEAGSIDARSSFNQADAIAEQIETLTRASDLAGTEAGRALSIRRMMVSRESFKITEVVRKAVQRKGKALTQEEKVELSKLVSKLEAKDKQVEALQKNLEVAEERASRAEAEKTVKKVKHSRKADKATIKKDRDAIKAELKKLGMRVNDISGISVEASIIIGKLAKTYVREGALTLDEVVKNIQRDVPDVSTRDIWDSISGRGRESRKKVKSEIEKRIASIKKQADLLSQIEDAGQGIFDKPKTVNADKKVKELRKKLNALRDEAMRGERDSKRLNDIVRKIDEIRDDIEAGVIRQKEKKKKRVDPAPIAEAKKKLKEVRTVRDLIAAIDLAEKGILPERKSSKPTPEIKALRGKLRKLREDLRGDRKEAREAEIKRLQEILDSGGKLEKKSRIPDDAATAEQKQKIRDLRSLINANATLKDLMEQLKTGKYKIQAKREVRIVSSELELARAKVSMAKKEIRQRIRDQEPMTFMRGVSEVAQFARTIKATADRSGVLRQAAWMASRMPVKAAKAVVEAERAAWSEDYYHLIDGQLRNIADEHGMVELGLELTETGGSLVKREEDFASDLAERIPGLGAVIKNSNRHMVTYLNMMRVESMKRFILDNPTATKADKQTYAKFINVNSGRGDLGKFDVTMGALSKLMFAPRFGVSRFQVGWMGAKQTAKAVKSGDWLVAKEIGKDYGAYVGTRLAILAMLAAAFDDDDENYIGDDWNDADFGKVVVGPMRLDLWSGHAQPARLLLSIADGTVSPYDKDFDPMSDIGRFLMYKLSPAVSTTTSLASSKDFLGRETPRSEIFMKALMPIIVETALETIAEGRSNEVIAATLASELVGIGVGVYDPSQSWKRGTRTWTDDMKAAFGGYEPGRASTSSKALNTAEWTDAQKAEVDRYYWKLLGDRTAELLDWNPTPSRKSLEKMTKLTRDEARREFQR